MTEYETEPLSGLYSKSLRTIGKKKNKTKLTGLAEEAAWKSEKVAGEGVVVRGMLGGKDLAWGYQALAKDPCLKNNSGVELSHLHENMA